MFFKKKKIKKKIENSPFCPGYIGMFVSLHLILCLHFRGPALPVYKTPAGTSSTTEPGYPKSWLLSACGDCSDNATQERAIATSQPLGHVTIQLLVYAYLNFGFESLKEFYFLNLYSIQEFKKRVFTWTPLVFLVSHVIDGPWC